MSDEPTERDVEARLARYAQSEEPLTDAEVASVRAERCGPLLYGGPCWLMPGHVGPHHCYREDVDAVAAHVRDEALDKTLRAWGNRLDVGNMPRWLRHRAAALRSDTP